MFLEEHLSEVFHKICVPHYILCWPKPKAKVLNEQYQQVFTEEDLTTIPDLATDSATLMKDVVITTTGVHKLLTDLNIHKATGPDLLPTRVLKEIVPVLALIFNQSYNSPITVVLYHLTGSQKMSQPYLRRGSALTLLITGPYL